MGGSGEVDIDEFAGILRRALRVPEGCDLPSSRVNHFWREIDRDCSGHVNFEEFLEWWLKHFDESGHVGSLPYDNFYKEMRDIGEIEMDWPACLFCVAQIECVTSAFLRLMCD